MLHNEEGSPTPGHVFVAKAEEGQNTAPTSVSDATLSADFIPDVSKQVEQKGDLEWPQTAAPHEKCQEPHPATSFQGLETFTLPLGFNSGLPFTNPFISTTFHPNSASKGNCDGLAAHLRRPSVL